MLDSLREFGRAVVFLFLILTDSCSQPPSDTKLIENFYTHRAIYESMAKDFCAMPHAQTVWTDTNHSRPRLSDQRQDKIVALMNKIGATRVEGLPAEDSIDPSPCMVEFTLWSIGMLDSSDSKSIVLSPVSDLYDLEVQSLDNIDFKKTVLKFGGGSNHGRRIYKRHLEGEWWLVWDHWE